MKSSPGRVHVFVGPSRAVRHSFPPGIIWHPPIRHGDLYRLAPGEGDVVAIIDGLYQQQVPVRHKEIIDLLAAGVRVVGGASLGALRAVELAAYGMHGVGWVYERYRDGVLQDDGDVALVHHEAENGYLPVTMAMVSIHAALEAAVARGALGESQAGEIRECAVRLHFTERTPRALTASVPGGLKGVARSLAEDICSGVADVKRADMLRVIETAIELPENSPFRIGMLPNSYAMEERFANQMVSQEPVSKREILRYSQLFDGEFPARHRDYVIGRLAEAGFPTLASAAAGIGATSLSQADLLRRSLITRDEARALPIDELHAMSVLRTFRLRPGRLVYEELPAWLEGRAYSLAEQVVRSKALTRAMRVDGRPIAHLPVTISYLKSAFSHIWNMTDIGVACLDRGFRDMEEFREAARQHLAVISAWRKLNAGNDVGGDLGSRRGRSRGNESLS
ncbi:MAG: hypothetical protein JWM19_2534 [Actinomycetia bacterium]|nr:hypothetical protein [Actinomycetes bacterium]